MYISLGLHHHRYHDVPPIQTRGTYLGPPDDFGGRILETRIFAFPFHKMKVLIYSSKLDVWAKIYLFKRGQWELLAELPRGQVKTPLNMFSVYKDPHPATLPRDVIELWRIARQKLRFWL